MLLAGSRWREYFDSVERDAFRLETRPVYRVPQEEDAVRRFTAGQPLVETDTAVWTDRVKGYRASGRTVARVHVLMRPLTDYLRFEFEHYRHNTKAGEEIRILDLTDRTDPGLPSQDYWMFDEARVVLMNYDSVGTQTNREVFEGDPAPYVEWKRLAMAESVLFEEYVTQFDA